MRNTNMHNQEGYAPVTADHGVKVLEPKEATVDSQQGVVKDSQQAVDNPKSEVQVKKGADEEPVAAAKIKSEEKYTKTTEEAAGVKTEAGAKAKAAEEATKTAFNDPTLVSMAQPLGQGSGAENPLDETRATVIVLWRESMSLTIPSLREVLSDPVVPVNVIYIHLDYFLSRGVLEEARQLQRQYTNLEVVVQSDWKNRHEMLREVLPSVKTRWVVVHDNNNKGLPRDWIQKLITAAKTTKPPPVLIAPLINAVDNQDPSKTQDHHAVIQVVLVKPQNATGLHSKTVPGSGEALLCWTGTHDGKKLHNTEGLEVISGDAVETHSYLVDAKRVDLKALYDTHNAFASYHIGFGLHLGERHGQNASAVLTGLEYSYMYPNTHMSVADVPFAMMRWNAWDNMHSILYLEQRYGVRYFHEAGFDWHSRAAFYDKLFYANGTSLTADAGLIAAVTVSVYALNFVNHFSVPQSLTLEADPELQAAQLASVAGLSQDLTIRELMGWINRNTAALSNASEMVLAVGKWHLPEREAFLRLTGLQPSEMQGSRAWIRENLQLLDEPLFGLHEILKVGGSADFDEVVDMEATPDLLWIQGSFTAKLHSTLAKLSHITLRSSDAAHADAPPVFRYLIRISSEPEHRGRGANHTKAEHEHGEGSGARKGKDHEHRKRFMKVRTMAKALGHTMCEALHTERACSSPDVYGKLQVLWTWFTPADPETEGSHLRQREGVWDVEKAKRTMATTAFLFDEHGKEVTKDMGGVLPLVSPRFELVSWGCKLKNADKYRRVYDSHAAWGADRKSVV